MADEVTYQAPVGEQVLPGTTKLAPVFLSLDLEAAEIMVKFAGENGVVIWAEWSDSAGEDATGLIQALNTANLSTKSLKRRLLERAAADGKIPAGGTVS